MLKKFMCFFFPLDLEGVGSKGVGPTGKAL